MKTFSYTTALIIGTLALTACHNHRHNGAPPPPPTNKPAQEMPLPAIFPPPIEMW